MFQFPSLPPLALFYSGESTRALPRVGFPIRKSRDQRLVSTSPGLIAAAHVLHRLLAPRHPPCALVLLIRKNTCVAAMEFSRCARGTPHSSGRLEAGLSKLNSVVTSRSTLFLGEPSIRTTYLPRGARLKSGTGWLSSKQPWRLPE